MDLAHLSAATMLVHYFILLVAVVVVVVVVNVEPAPSLYAIGAALALWLRRGFVAGFAVRDGRYVRDGIKHSKGECPDFASNHALCNNCKVYCGER